jgi:hypothetical protein
MCVCVFVQLLERNRYSTTHALLLHAGLPMYPLKRVEEQAKALNIVDIVESKESSSAKFDGNSEQ